MKLINNKAFTLVEVLGTITILAIILTIATIAYKGVNEHIISSYYMELESSLLISGGEYYQYSKDKQPKVFGDEYRVDIQEIVKSGYSTEVLSRNKNTCSGFIGAYIDSFNKTNYYVCLTCDDYESDNKACQSNINYSIKITPKINETDEIYPVDTNTYINGFVRVYFETLNDVKIFYLEDSTGKLKSCNVQNNSCYIDIYKTDTYFAYGVNNEMQTNKESLKILIAN